MLFSSSDKCKIQLIKLLCPVISSLAWYYTQDALLSLTIHFMFNLILLPFVISKILNKDIYDILGFKTMIPQTKSKTKMHVTIGLLALTLAFNIAGVYFGKIPNFRMIVSLGPMSQYRFIVYLYYLLVAEMKFYYGVLSVIEPDSFWGYLSVGLFMTAHWVGFAFAFLNNNVGFPTYLFLIIMLIFYMGLYHVKETSSYKDSRWVYLVVFGVNYALLFFYGVLYSYRKVSGVAIATANAKNVWNKII